jgi:hypothetical protein
MVPDSRNDENEMERPSLLGAIGRLLGFLLLAGASMALFAGVLLVPDYARLQHALYEQGRQEASVADLQTLVQANDRLIANLPDDPVLVKRLAMNQYGLFPKDEQVVLDERTQRPPPPGMIVTEPHPRPAMPTGWFLEAAERISNPPTRRGLLLLAAAAMFAAIFLFPAREDRRKPLVAAKDWQQYHDTE